MTSPGSRGVSGSWSQLSYLVRSLLVAVLIVFGKGLVSAGAFSPHASLWMTVGAMGWLDLGISVLASLRPIFFLIISTSIVDRSIYFLVLVLII